MCIDLHIHSHFSDGTASPAALIDLAVKSGVRGLSLTDHDTVEGVGEFLAYGRQFDLEVFSGLEISALHREFSLHILGYGFDHHNYELRRWLERLQEGRNKRNREIIDKLKIMGHDINFEELAQISPNGQTGRPHIAKLLKKRGIVQTTEDAFSQFIRKGGPAFAERFAYSATESIDMIHQAGGIAVLAHPVFLEQQTNALSLVIAELVERGLDGIEIFYPTHSPTLQKKLRTLALKYHLVVTGGSDYHGKERTFSSLAGEKSGFCPPDSLLEPMKKRLLNIARDKQQLEENS